uniref:Mediator complex subunit 15 n=1 Tax=Heterorhabditis bacteriophora TaxID=37862 RepID=A0A1I7W9N6_HETBA
MNYNNTGQYGQPMGQGMAPIQGQMMNMQAQQRICLISAVQAITCVDIYMMGGQPSQSAPGMRTMFGQPQPGMMTPQGPGQPMYAPPQMHAQIQQQQQQQQQQQYSYFMQRFPITWRQEINLEQNPDRKRQLFHSYVKKQQMMINNGQSPAMIHQNISGGTNPMIPGQRGGPMVTQPSASIYQGISPMTSSGIQPSGMTSLSTQQQHSGQQMFVIAFSVNLMVKILNLENPASVQPSSVGAPGSQQPPSVPGQEERSKEYDDTIKNLKDQFYEKLKRIRDRFNMDNSPKPPGFDRLMEILDDKRTVPMPLLEKIVGNVRTVVERHSLTYPVLEAIRVIEKEISHDTVAVEIPPITSIDPWKDVRHMMIRVPDHIVRLYKDDKISSDKSFKRRSDGSFWNENEPSTKITKVEARTAEPLLYTPAVISSPIDSQQDSADGDYAESKRIKIDCLFDNRKPWKMSVTASRELNDLPWRVDTDCLPASSQSADAVICFDSQLIVCPPLRVLVPASYPLDPAVIQFDRSFPRGVQVSGQLSTLGLILQQISANLVMKRYETKRPHLR